MSGYPLNTQWQGGGLTFLGFDQAYDVSADASTIVGQHNGTAALYQGGVFSDLGDIGGGSTSSTAFATNQDGSVVDSLDPVRIKLKPC